MVENSTADSPDRREVVRRVATQIETLLAQSPGRVIIGVVGAPGSGKSTFAADLCARLGSAKSVVVPMDGFHLAGSVITGSPLEARKGAVDTFDGWGYVALLRRLRSQHDDVVYAPTYVRTFEEPIAGSIPVDAQVPIVITEGNYLLVDQRPWAEISGLLDRTYFLDVPERSRVARLIARHVEFGKDLGTATAWANGPDAANAALIAQSRSLADEVIGWGADADSGF